MNNNTQPVDDIVLHSGARFDAFTIRAMTGGGGSIWTKVGSAFVNKDGSINLYLDAIPLNGRIYLRRPTATAKHEN
ncbi:MAG: hypothetical protein QM817_40760 [Archangium sp.]